MAWQNDIDNNGTTNIQEWIAYFGDVTHIYSQFPVKTDELILTIYVEKFVNYGNLLNESHVCESCNRTLMMLQSAQNYAL